MADTKISALTDGNGLAAGDQIPIDRAGTNYRAQPLGVPVLVYRYTVAGSDKASIDTGSDTADAGSNDWTNGDLLEVFVMGRTDDSSTSGVVSINLNNDTGSNYEYQFVRGSASSASAANASAQAKWVALLAAASDTAGVAGALAMVIPTYAGTTFRKIATLTEVGTDSIATARLWALAWNSTSAITRLKLSAAAGQKLKVGTQLLIYKRLAS